MNSFKLRDDLNKNKMKITIKPSTMKKKRALAILAVNGWKNPDGGVNCLKNDQTVKVKSTKDLKRLAISVHIKELGAH